MFKAIEVKIFSMMKNMRFAITFLMMSNISLAQIPVSQEPRHHDIFDNGHLRLLDVHIPPGDTSQFHIHATPSVFVILSNVKTGSEVISEEDHTNSLIPHFGDIWFEGFYLKPRIHRVWNSDSSEFHVMDIELPNKNYKIIDSPIRQSSFTFLFDERPVRGYRLKLEPASKTFVESRKAEILIILLSDSTELVQANGKSFHKKGDYLYISSGNLISIENDGSAKAVFVFFELR